MDPLSVLAAATAAYNALRTGIEVGKELQGMAGDLSSLWQSAAQLTRMAADPPKKTLFLNEKDAEAKAIEIYVAKQKALEMTLAARNMFIGQYGLNAWDGIQKEVIRIKREAERMRIEEERATEQRREEIKEVAVVTLIVMGILGVMGLIGVALLMRGG